MQRLANVTRSFRTAGVLVHKGAASSEIQQRHAAKYGYRASAGNELCPVHMFCELHSSV